MSLDLFASSRLSDIDAVRMGAEAVARAIDALPPDLRVAAVNAARREIHAVSPFRNEPIDFVEWVEVDSVRANDYNPNSVAPPEMALLETSILQDGYTQPIVSHDQGDYRLVIDGFHRSRVGKESAAIRKRTLGHLPVVQIKADRTDDTARMASTIRHNRARGKHAVEPMTGIISYLAKKGWDDAKIGKELGMEPDEVLRLKQITGLAELFADKEFSEAWEVI